MSRGFHVVLVSAVMCSWRSDIGVCCTVVARNMHYGDMKT